MQVVGEQHAVEQLSTCARTNRSATAFAMGSLEPWGRLVPKEVTVETWQSRWRLGPTYCIAFINHVDARRCDELD
jgi:hypothetical protein